jgi:hypothetical protein
LAKRCCQRMSGGMAAGRSGHSGWCGQPSGMEIGDGGRCGNSGRGPVVECFGRQEQRLLVNAWRNKRRWKSHL